ncbi:MAG: hypothetical protein ACOC3G_07005, partial [Phycisphaeraceae bacterium]
MACTPSDRAPRRSPRRRAAAICLLPVIVLFAASTGLLFAQQTREDARQQQGAEEDRATRSALDPQRGGDGDTPGGQTALDPQPETQPDPDAPPPQA